VRGGRWKGLVVLTAALVVVGGLIWKPWDQPSSPAPTPTPGLVGLAHPSPSPPPIATLLVIPDDPGVIAPPPTSGGPAVSDEPSPPDSGGFTGSVSLDAGGKAYVACSYDMTANPPSLAHVIVSPPVIATGHGGTVGQLKAVSWTAVLETNQLSAIFEADWRPLDVSKTQVFNLRGRGSVTFKPVTFDVRSLPVGTSDVLRVTVLVNWIGPHGTRLFQTSIVASSYAPADSPTSIVPEGCASVRLTG
jgi:hypothetical protein